VGNIQWIYITKTITLHPKSDDKVMKHYVISIWMQLHYLLHGFWNIALCRASWSTPTLTCPKNNEEVFGVHLCRQHFQDIGLSHSWSQTVRGPMLICKWWLNLFKYFKNNFIVKYAYNLSQTFRILVDELILLRTISVKREKHVRRPLLNGQLILPYLQNIFE
jgi:hypothetical protein